MATVLDVGLLSFLMPLFIFLFIFSLIYALLSKTKMFGDGMSALNFLAAACISAVTVFAGTITNVVASIIPWIVFIIIVLLLVFAMFSFFGLKNDEIWDSIFGKTWIFVLILIVILIGLSQAFESQISPYGQNDTVSSTTSSGAVQSGTVKGEVIKTLTHPRLLGALFILIVSAISIKLISDKIITK